MIAESFKQVCPSCETSVLIKSPGMVGKKMECPKCKDAFLVARPAMNGADDDSGEHLALQSAIKPAARKSSSSASNGDRASGKTAKKSIVAAQGKNSARQAVADEEDEDEITSAESDDDDEAKPAGKKPVAKKPAAKKPMPDDDDDDDDEDEEAAAKPVKKLAAKKPTPDDNEEAEEAATKTRKPAAKKPTSDDDDEDDAEQAATRPAKKVAAKKPVRKVDDGDDEITEAADDEDETETAARTAAAITAKKPAVKAKPRPAADDDDDEGEEASTTAITAKKPVAKARPAMDDEDDDEETSTTAITSKKPAAKAKTKPAADDDDDGDDEAPIAAKKPAARAKTQSAADDDEDEEAESAKKSAKTKSDGDEEDADETPSEETEAEEAAAEQEKPRKRFSFKNFSFKNFSFKNFNIKKLVGSKKTAIGAALAVVGILVLSWAGYLMIFGTNRPRGAGLVASPAGGKPQAPTKGGQGSGVKNVFGGKTPAKGPKGPVYKRTSFEQLASLLPRQTEQVVRYNFGDMFNERKGPFYDAVFQPARDQKVFNETIMDSKLGFSVMKVADLIQAECFSDPAWSFSIVHVLDKLDLAKLKTALNLKNIERPKVTAPKKEKAPNVDYFLVPPNPWLDQLGRLSPGSAPAVRQMIPQRKDRPLFLHMRDDQTLIFADEKPMIDHLRDVLDKFENKPADRDPNDPIVLPLASLELRTMVENMAEVPSATSSNPWKKPLYFSATLLPKSALPAKNKNDIIQFRPRPLWDFTKLIEERHPPRLSVLGVSVFTQGNQPFEKFRFRTDVECFHLEEARSLVKELEGGSLKRGLDLVDSFLKVKFEHADKARKVEASAGDDKAKIPSLFSLTRNERVITCMLELNLNRKDMAESVALLMQDAHAELALFEETGLRHKLSKASLDMVTADEKHAPWRKLLGEAKAPPGQYPPGAFPLGKGDVKVRNPGDRVSWMAALLPYMGHQGLYERIDFKHKWHDSANGPAGRTLVEQFIVPEYPESTRYYEHPDLDQVYGATHFVGIGGVGLDAPDSVLGTSRRGILGYDSSVSIDDIQEKGKGRGLANTVLMLQVPYDNLGVTPWIAGGGATLRGVPEKNSIQPFLVNGKGTYALMADGSVRYISYKVSDPVFQTMCTYQGPAPPGFDLNQEVTRLLVPENLPPPPPAKAASAK